MPDPYIVEKNKPLNPKPETRNPKPSMLQDMDLKPRPDDGLRSSDERVEIQNLDPNP